MPKKRKSKKKPVEKRPVGRPNLKFKHTERARMARTLILLKKMGFGTIRELKDMILRKVGYISPIPGWSATRYRAYIESRVLVFDLKREYERVFN